MRRGLQHALGTSTGPICSLPMLFQTWQGALPDPSKSQLFIIKYFHAINGFKIQHVVTRCQAQNLLKPLHTLRIADAPHSMCCGGSNIIEVSTGRWGAAAQLCGGGNGTVGGLGLRQEHILLSVCFARLRTLVRVQLDSITGS